MFLLSPLSLSLSKQVSQTSYCIWIGGLGWSKQGSRGWWERESQRDDSKWDPTIYIIKTPSTWQVHSPQPSEGFPWNQYGVYRWGVGRVISAWEKARRGKQSICTRKQERISTIRHTVRWQTMSLTTESSLEWVWICEQSQRTGRCPLRP